MGAARDGDALRRGGDPHHADALLEELDRPVTVAAADVQHPRTGGQLGHQRHYGRAQVRRRVARLIGREPKLWNRFRHGWHTNETLSFASSKLNLPAGAPSPLSRGFLR